MAQWGFPLAVFAGAGLGALLRWMLALRLNEPAGWLPWGTLAANLLGGLLMGVLLGAPAGSAPWVGEGEAARLWRALLATGFLGGLTTFSTFSAEVVERLVRGDWWMGAGIAGLHLFGSLSLTLLGWALGKSAWGG